MREATVRPRNRSQQVGVYLVGLFVVLGFVSLLLWRYVFITVLPGNVGVVYSLLGGGTVVDEVYGEGLVVKLPWNRFYIFETRVRANDYEVLALSEEGMLVNAQFTVLYRVRPDQAGRLLKEIGPNYEDRIVRPLAIGGVREMVSQSSSHELYTIDSRQFKQRLMEFLNSQPFDQIVDFRDVILRRIALPQNVVEAIEEKLQREQEAASYVFRLKAEELEAERRRIEAIGIQTYYSIISDALTKPLLTWRGIEATVELAKSSNSKIVIVGGGEDQLPLILGSDIHQMPATPAPVSPISPDQHPLPDWSTLPKVFSDTPPLPEARARGAFTQGTVIEGSVDHYQGTTPSGVTPPGATGVQIEPESGLVRPEAESLTPPGARSPAPPPNIESPAPQGTTPLPGSGQP